MTAKKPVVRRAAGAALALVLALVVVGSVAAARDRTPPTTPTNLKATSLSQTSVTLAWDPSTDKSGTVTYSVTRTVSPSPCRGGRRRTPDRPGPS
jgi:hypothetical protein